MKIFHNAGKLINDVSIQNATLEMFSKCKQNQLTKFIHVRISTENRIGKKALNNFWLKKLSNKGTIVKARLALENSSLDTLVPFDFLLCKQDVMLKYNQLYTSIDKII